MMLAHESTLLQPPPGTFHAPSFGEEDFKFEIPAITLPTDDDADDVDEDECNSASSPLSHQPPRGSSQTPQSAVSFSPTGSFSGSQQHYPSPPLSHPATVGNTHFSPPPVPHHNGLLITAANYPVGLSSASGGINSAHPPPAYSSAAAQRQTLGPQHLSQQQQQNCFINQNGGTVYHGSIQVQSNFAIYNPNLPPHLQQQHIQQQQQQQQQQGGYPTLQQLQCQQQHQQQQRLFQQQQQLCQQQQQQQNFYQRLVHPGHHTNGLYLNGNSHQTVLHPHPSQQSYINGYPAQAVNCNLPQLSQFIPPPMMAAAGQQREPILQTMGSSVVAESPAGSTITSPSRDSDSSDDTPLSQLNLKRPAQDRPTPKSGGKKAKGGAGGNKKKKKKDPNEPQKPVSAYALFFRDTQAAIKNQNPNATFGEVSKIVASMWDGLDEETKGGYKKRTEVAKKEYLKQLAAYRASLVSQGALDPAELEKSPPHLSPERPSPPRDNIAANTTTPLSHPPTPATTANQGGQLQPIAPKPANSSPSQNTAMDAASFYGTHQTGATGHQQQGAAGGGGEQPMAPPPSMCIRQGCQQNAVVHPNWDNEYCSNECVVDHCRDVFGAWVATRHGSGGGGNSFASVK